MLAGSARGPRDSRECVLMVTKNVPALFSFRRAGACVLARLQTHSPLLHPSPGVPRSHIIRAGKALVCPLPTHLCSLVLED